MNRRLDRLIGPLYIFLISFITIIHLYVPTIEASQSSSKVIPHDAIRLRILANSNSETDQQLKLAVRDAINEQITDWVKNLTSLDEARNLMKNRLHELQLVAETVVEQSNTDQKVEIDFNKVDFPTKQYGQFIYPAGEYEAIVIKLGRGEGLNWWCVLFPPLCFLDFSNGGATSEGFTNKHVNNNVTKDEQAETRANKIKSEDEEQPLFIENDEEEIKVTFFVKELWEKLFK